MPGVTHSDPLVTITIEKYKDKLNAYSDELVTLNISKQESHRKIDFLRRNLKTIEFELQNLSDKKNELLKELNSVKVTASLLDARVKDLTQAIDDLNHSIHQLENQPRIPSFQSTRRNSFLRSMDQTVPWVELIALIEPHYAKLKDIEDEQEIQRMLRVYLIQHWFKLTPKALEENLHDSLSMRDFVGTLRDSQSLPDRLSIESFIHFLNVNELDKVILTKVQEKLILKGLTVSNGKIIDASLSKLSDVKLVPSDQPSSPDISLSPIKVTKPTELTRPTTSSSLTPLVNNSPNLSPNLATTVNTVTTPVSGSVSGSSTTPLPPAKPLAPKIIKNKLSFFDYLSTYGEPKKLITDIVTEFHALVVEKKETRHYLFNANIDNLIADQNNFVSYIFPKERISQSNPIAQTAPPTMRIAISTFDEIANMLTYLLVDHYKVERKTAPTAAAHILELIEETRCQIEDTNQTVWKPIELKASLIERFFSMKGFICRSTSASEISILGGLEFPLSVLIDASARCIVLKAVCKANDWANLDDITSLKDTLNEKVSSLNFDVNVIDEKPILTTQYCVPYSRGVPNRLLLKVCQSFAGAIAKGLEIDETNLMVKPST